MERMPTVKLLYNKKDLKDEDAKLFIDLAKKKLADTFTNETNNKLLLLIFISSEIFKSKETEAVRKVVDDSLEFTEKFCALLKDRDDVVGALNQLLNLNDSDLTNYEKKIRKSFKELKPENLVLEVIQPQSEQNLGSNAPPQPPRRQLGVIIPQQEQVDGQSGGNLTYMS